MAAQGSDNDIQKLITQINIHLGAFYSEKLVFLVQNFTSNSEVIPEVVNFKAFEFPALAETLTEWPTVVDL
jgi:hypothetical protein